MTTPLLLLDIDGVYIPFPDQDGNGPRSHTRCDVTPTGFPPGKVVSIWLNPAHGPMTAGLIDSGLVDPAWATSWHHDANTIIGARLGIRPIGVVELGRPNITTSHPNGYLWKRDLVSAWLADRPAAWIDDDFTELDHEWATARTAAGIPTLLVQPDSKVGITVHHLDQVRTWAHTAATHKNRTATSV